MYNKQDIKPLLPSINHPNQKQPGYLPLPFNTPKAIPMNTNGNFYNTPHNNQGPSINQSNGNLPPIQFYSTKDHLIPHYEVQDPSLGMNYMSPGFSYGTYNVTNTKPGSIGSNSEDEKQTIDYSSIIGYTNSPSLKRKRRNKSMNSYTIPEHINGEEQPKLPCQVCGKIFAKPYNLKSHMKSHSTEKPFKCTVCSKTFARSHDKKRHELLHNGEKNFKCEGVLKDGKTAWGCGKKFARSDALSRHFRTETGWLCIKPLMDEAKHLETNETTRNDLINSFTRHGGI